MISLIGAPVATFTIRLFVKNAENKRLLGGSARTVAEIYALEIWSQIRSLIPPPPVTPSQLVAWARDYNKEATQCSPFVLIEDIRRQWYFS